jgi:hypothetical protein
MNPGALERGINSEFGNAALAGVTSPFHSLTQTGELAEFGSVLIRTLPRIRRICFRRRQRLELRSQLFISPSHSGTFTPLDDGLLSNRQKGEADMEPTLFQRMVQSVITRRPRKETSLVGSIEGNPRPAAYDSQTRKSQLGASHSARPSAPNSIRTAGHATAAHAGTVCVVNEAAHLVRTKQESVLCPRMAPGGVVHHGGNILQRCRVTTWTIAHRSTASGYCCNIAISLTDPEDAAKRTSLGNVVRSLRGPHLACATGHVGASWSPRYLIS